MTGKSVIAALLLALIVSGAAAQEANRTLTLTLDDAVARALRGNLDLAVEVLSPAIAETALDRSREIFMPQLNVDFTRQSTESPSTWWLQGAALNKADTVSYGTTVSQLIPMGGRASLSITGYTSDSNQQFSLINPYYQSTLRLNVTQPLLKGFGDKPTRQAILVARNNLEVSETQLRGAVIETVFQVEQAYWNLVLAIESLGVRRQSLELGRDTLAKTRKEIEVGQTAPIEALSAQATVAQREADILAAEAAVDRAAETLKSAINLDVEGEDRLLAVVPEDRPAFRPEAVDLDEALRSARERRPDLQIAATTVDTSRINLSVARNNLLPQLDLSFQYWSPGVSGDRLVYLDNNPLTGIIVQKVEGSSAKSLKDSFKFLYQNWNIGFTLTLPIADLVSRASLAQARLELERDEASLRTRERQAFLEVSDAVRTLETDAKRVEAFRVARELAEKQLEAETKKLGVGLTTNYFVLQYQDRLAQARSAEIGAMVDYRVSQARVERVTGRSLETRNIRLTDVGIGSDK